LRLLGLDVGSKTIGLALSDELHLTAQPVGVLARKGTRADVATLLSFCAEHEVSEVVAGWPLELDGREAHRARRVGVLLDALAAGFAGPVHRWDERLTTVAAERVLLEADVSRAGRRRNVDKLAASIILQTFLDHRRMAADRERGWPDDPA